MQICEQSGHLGIVEAAVEGWHHSLARKNRALHIRIRGWCTAGERGSVEDGVEIGWNRLQFEIVVFVAVRAPYFVEMLPSRFLIRKRRG